MQYKLNKAGYVLVKSPDHPNAVNGYVLQHRIVVEEYIERLLKPEECIHHIDMDKTHNSINNLMLFKTAKEHSAFHIKVRRFGFTGAVLLQIQNRWATLLS